MAGKRETDRLPVCVISDGKPGHENQSLGIAESLPGADILLLRHRLKESPAELLLRLSIAFSELTRAKTVSLLKRVFPEAEILRMVDHRPLAVLSAGTLSAGPCLLAATLTGAKSCVCMRPSLIPLSRFDLAVLPEHDRPPKASNVLTTLAAPNRVSPDLLEREAELWRPELPENTERTLAWIIGGPSGSARFNEQHVLKGLLAALDWASSHGWQVWLSTARRTPENLENELAALSHPALTFMLLWHRDSRNPLYAMFRHARFAVVTSDSVSMVAEAATAGRGPIIYEAAAETSRARSKQHRMLEALLKRGYGARASNPEELVALAEGIQKEKKVFPCLDDTRRAAKRLFEML